jgi:hypothetical protein
MYGRPITQPTQIVKQEQKTDGKLDLSWFKDRVGKDIYKTLKLVHEVKKITVRDEEHATYLYSLQMTVGSSYFEKEE